MYFTHDLVSKEENSYWEFLDNKSAKLVMEEGSYYEANYTHIRDEIGMMYTEYKFSQYPSSYYFSYSVQLYISNKLGITHFIWAVQKTYLSPACLSASL